MNFFRHNVTTGLVDIPAVREEMGLIAMKGHPTLPRSPELDAQHQQQFNVTP